MYPSYPQSPSPSPLPPDGGANARMNIYNKFQPQGQGQQHPYQSFQQAAVHHPYGYPNAPNQPGMYGGNTGGHHPGLVGPVNHIGMGHHAPPGGLPPHLNQQLGNSNGMSNSGNTRGGLNANATPVMHHRAPINNNSQSMPMSANWQEQAEMAKISRQASSPHHHARYAILNGRQTANNPMMALTNPSIVIYSGKEGHRKEPSYGSDLVSSQTSPPLRPGSADPTALGEAVETRRGGGKEAKTHWSTIDMGGMNLKVLSPAIFRYSFLTVLYLTHNHLSSLPPAIAKLKHLEILDVSSNRLTSVPSELGLLHSLRELYLFDNMITTLPAEFGYLYQLRKLGLEGNPLDDMCRKLVDQQGTTGLIEYIRDNSPIPVNEPPPRVWKKIENELSSLEKEHDQENLLEERAEEEEAHLLDIVDDVAKTATDKDKSSKKPLYDKFTVMCYNILFEKYATTQLYGYTPSWALKWSYRRERILKEIRSYGTDIICLQEVGEDQFNNYFAQGVEGYMGVFRPKSRARTMSREERINVDGCGVLFKEDVFSLIETHLIEFNQVGNMRPDFKKTEDLYNRVLTRDNIALILTLEHKLSGARLIVANVHFHWDPEFSDVKLVQAGVLTDDLEKISARFAKLPPRRDLGEGYGPAPTYNKANQIPTIICGDFNSTPDSGVYEFLSRGTLPPKHHDFLNREYGKFTEEGLKHNISLKSAYSNVGELEFTNLTPGYTGTIDYLWYSTNSLVVSHLLDGIDEDYVSQVIGFPNVHFPSDHIPVLSEFKFKPSPNK